VLHKYLCRHLVSKAKARAEKQQLDEIEDEEDNNNAGRNALHKWTKIGYRANKQAVQIRDEFTRYFYREGQINFQWKLSKLRNKKIPQLLYDAES
jgi:hypothetical protein